MKSLKLTVIAALAVVALAACGGSASTPAPAASAPGGGSSAAPSTASVPAATPAAGASTPASQAAAGGSIDLCGLLSPTDLKTVTGADYGAGVLDDVGECTWRVGGATSNNGKGQVVAGITAATIDFIKSSFGSGGSDVTVSGRAGFWNPSSGLQSIWIDIGGGNLLVLSLDPIDDSSQASAKKLAEIAVSKM